MELEILYIGAGSSGIPASLPRLEDSKITNILHKMGF